MKRKFINWALSIIKEYNQDMTKKEIDTIAYGLEGLYLTITKLIIIFIISFILGILKEVVLLLLIFNGIRLFAFGVHAKRSIDCLIASLILFIIFPILCIKIVIPISVKYILFLPFVITIGIFSPSDTEKRPLKKKKKRIMYKILSIIVSILYMVLSIIIKDNTLSNCFIFALIIQIIIILPITYKVFGVSYNNYKKYEVSN